MAKTTYTIYAYFFNLDGKTYFYVGQTTQADFRRRSMCGNYTSNMNDFICRQGISTQALRESSVILEKTDDATREEFHRRALCEKHPDWVCLNHRQGRLTPEQYAESAKASKHAFWQRPETRVYDKTRRSTTEYKNRAAELRAKQEAFCKEHYGCCLRTARARGLWDVNEYKKSK